MHSYRVAPLILVKNKNFIIMGPGWLTAGSLPLFPFFSLQDRMKNTMNKAPLKAGYYSLKFKRGAA